MPSRVMSSVSAKNSSGRCIVKSSSRYFVNFSLPPISFDHRRRIVRNVKTVIPGIALDKSLIVC